MITLKTKPLYLDLGLCIIFIECNLEKESNRSLNVFDTKIVDNWWTAIHGCPYDKFDFDQIDLSNQTHLVICICAIELI